MLKVAQSAPTIAATNAAKPAWPDREELMSRIRRGLLAASVLAISLPMFSVTMIGTAAAARPAATNNSYHPPANNNRLAFNNNRNRTTNRTPPVVPRRPVSTTGFRQRPISD
jgi:hypothetical protein